MNLLLIILIGLSVMFIGFAIGRFCDKLGGHLDVPHHWIYGLLMVVLSFFIYMPIIGLMLFSFGTGHFLSDLDDFVHLRLWGVDESSEWEFWSIK